MDTVLKARKLERRMELEGSVGCQMECRRTASIQGSLEPKDQKNECFQNPYELEGPSMEHQLYRRGHGREHHR